MSVYAECLSCGRRVAAGETACSHECARVVEASFDAIASMGRYLDAQAEEDAEHLATCRYCVDSELAAAERRSTCLSRRAGTPLPPGLAREAHEAAVAGMARPWQRTQERTIR